MQQASSDILLLIFGYLPGLSLLSAASVCHSFSKLVETEKLWEDIHNHLRWKYIAPGKANFLMRIKQHIRITKVQPPQLTALARLKTLHIPPPPPKKELAFIINPNHKQCKSVFIGQANVGKTSLATRIGINDFYDDHIGAFHIKHVQAKDPATKQVTDVEIALWVNSTISTNKRQDTGTMPPNFYDNAKIAFVLYSVDNYDSFQEISRWFSKMPLDCVCVLIGAKSDLKCNVPEEEARQFAKERGMLFFQVSAKTGENVKEMVKAVVEQFLDCRLTAERVRNYIGCEPIITTK